MSKFRDVTLEYVCHCPSKGTVYVPRVGNIPASYECRSPICIAIRAKIAQQAPQNQALIQELKKTIQRLIAKKVTCQEIFDRRIEQIVAKHEGNIVDISKSLVQILGPFPVPPREEKAVKDFLRPIKTIQKPRRAAPVKPAIFVIPKKMPPLPLNFMVGETYVSGIATSFGDADF